MGCAGWAFTISVPSGTAPAASPVYLRGLRSPEFQAGLGSLFCTSIVSYSGSRIPDQINSCGCSYGQRHQLPPFQEGKSDYGAPDVTYVVAVLFIQGQLSGTSRLAQAASGPRGNFEF